LYGKNGGLAALIFNLCTGTLIDWLIAVGSGGLAAPMQSFGGLLVSMLASGTFGGLLVSMLASGTFGGLLVSMLASGTFGGLVVSMLASGTQGREFAPGRSRRTFRAKNISACLPSKGK
jgi:hypothetical protein